MIGAPFVELKEELAVPWHWEASMAEKNRVTKEKPKTVGLFSYQRTAIQN